MLLRDCAALIGGLVAAVAGCAEEPHGPNPGLVTVSIVVYGTLTYSDSTPVVGARIYKYPSLGNPEELSTISDPTGKYSLGYWDACVTDGYAVGVGITPPPTRLTTGGTCSGDEIRCANRSYRRDCVFDLVSNPP